MPKQFASQPEFVCDLAALDAEQKKRFPVVLEQLQRSIQKIKELPNGYSFLPATDAATLMFVAEYITLEHLCCPFLDLTLEVERDPGLLWLRITGPEGVKQLLRAEWSFVGAEHSEHVGKEEYIYRKGVDKDVTDYDRLDRSWGWKNTL